MKSKLIISQIGYCQSLNFLVGILLMHMDEEDAFWTLDAMLRDYLPSDLYDPSLRGLHCELYVMNDYRISLIHCRLWNN